MQVQKVEASLRSAAHSLLPTHFSHLPQPSAARAAQAEAQAETRPGRPVVFWAVAHFGTDHARLEFVTRTHLLFCRRLVSACFPGAPCGVVSSALCPSSSAALPHGHARLCSARRHFACLQRGRCLTRARRRSRAHVPAALHTEREREAFHCSRPRAPATAAHPAPAAGAQSGGARGDSDSRPAG